MKLKKFKFKKVKSTNNTAIRIIKETNHNIGLKLSLLISSLFILFYFTYPSWLIEIVEKINII